MGMNLILCGDDAWDLDKRGWVKQMYQSKANINLTSFVESWHSLGGRRPQPGRHSVLRLLSASDKT